jgi:hypothetical protein
MVPLYVTPLETVCSPPELTMVFDATPPEKTDCVPILLSYRESPRYV